MPHPRKDAHLPHIKRQARFHFSTYGVAVNLRWNSLSPTALLAIHYPRLVWMVSNALGLKNLYPFPDPQAICCETKKDRWGLFQNQNVVEYRAIASTRRMGWTRSWRRIPGTVLHLKKKVAIQLLFDTIINECAIKTGQAVQQVIWRHTGGGGNMARNFIYLTEADKLRAFIKVGGRRYQDIPLTSSNSEVDFALSCLPDNLFISAAEAIHKWNTQGIVSWFPESRDEKTRKGIDMLKTYKQLLNTKLRNQPCIICGKKVLRDESTLQQKNGKTVVICKKHPVVQ